MTFTWKWQLQQYFFENLYFSRLSCREIDDIHGIIPLGFSHGFYISLNNPLRLCLLKKNPLLFTSPLFWRAPVAALAVFTQDWRGVKCGSRLWWRGKGRDIAKYECEDRDFFCSIVLFFVDFYTPESLKNVDIDRWCCSINSISPATNRKLYFLLKTKYSDVLGWDNLYHKLETDAKK